MPRIYSSDNDPLDFCNRHFPNEQNAIKKYSNCGDGPDSRGNCFNYDTEHPDYYDDEYRCVICKCKLTSLDNHKKGLK